MMNKNTSKKDTKLIAVYDGVLYVYHDGSWHEKESWRTDEELSNKQSWKKIVAREGEILNVRELYKGTNVLESIPKFIITTSELPRVTPGSVDMFRRLPLIPFCNEDEEKEATKES